MSLQHLIWPVLLALLFFWGAGIRSRLGQQRQHIQLTFGQLHTQIKHRHDMLTPLLEAHPLPLTHIDAHNRILAARAQVAAACTLVATRPGQNSPLKSLVLAEEVFQSAMQAPPCAMGEAWEEADQRVNYARHVFNEAVAQFNHACSQWPTRPMARLLGFRVTPSL